MSSHSFNIEDLLAYGFAIAPIVFGHLIVPPLSFTEYGLTEIADGNLRIIFSTIYEYFTPSVCFTRDFCNNLVLIRWRNEHISLKDFKTGWITHIFIHSNYAHLIGNLSHLVLHGHQVYREIGLAGLYALFIGGGIVSATPSYLYKLSEWEESFSKDFVKAKTNYLPESWSKKLAGAAELTAKHFYQNRPLGLCGSSGSVCCFIGFNFVIYSKIVISQLYNAIAESKPKGNRTRNMSTSLYITNWAKETFGRLFKLSISGSFVRPLMETIVAFNYFKNEMILLNPFKAVESLQFPNYFTKYLALRQLGSVGHAAHIQGAAFGVAFGLVFGVAVPYIHRRSKRGRRRDFVL